ncbi:hypothetical protein D3C78_517580 [compost metagenome]
MSELKSQPIAQGTRKRTEYDDSHRARLALNIQRSDGGTLQIPLLLDARSTEEQEHIQQNTLLAVVPLARLPGHDRYDQAPKGGLPRPGRIYVFFRQRLWRELVCDGQGQLFEVDIAHWRKLAEQGGQADERAPVGIKQHLILLPMLLQGRFVGDQLDMAYSELPWTWEYIHWLEASSERIRERCQNAAPAWAAAVVGPEQWKATQAMAAIPITRISKGMRARELHVETLLEDPLLFTPQLRELPATALVTQLEQRKQELASHLQLTPPEPLPTLPEGKDLFTEYRLRGHPQLVGLMLDDPLFAMRHAVAQSRLCAELLQTLNALIPHQPFGLYAELLYRHAGSASGPLADFRPHIDMPALEKAVLHAERRAVRDHLQQIQSRIVGLAGSRLPVLFNDFLHARDERLCEPYALVSEIQQALRSPASCDPRCIEAEDAQAAKAACKLAAQLAEGKHALTRGLLPEGAKPPEALQRLLALKQSNNLPVPERVGISSMNFFAQAYATQNLMLGIDELFGDFIKSTSLAIQEISQNEKLTQLRLDRLFAPSFDLLKQLHSQAAGLQRITQGKALSEGLVVLGVHGAGLSFGLTLAERQTMARQNFQYANLQGKDGSTIASSSLKQANRLNFARQNLGPVTVVAAPADDPLVAQFTRVRGIAPHLGRLEAVGSVPVLPTLAVVCAAFNLYANTVGAASLWESERLRFGAGAISAATDLALASNTTVLRILEGFGKTHTHWYTLWEKKGFYIQSEHWAKILRERTGSNLLSYSRIANVGGVALTAGLFAWDGYRAYRDGEDDQALAYGGLAFTGAVTWALYGLGLLGGPLTLAVGLGLFVGGLLSVALLADGPAEQAVKHGPFGTKQRLPQMNDPSLAYQQLLGTLGQPVIRTARLHDWLAKAPDMERQQVQAAAAQQRVELHPLDWVVELQSALLSQYPAGQGFVLRAWERRAIRTHTSGWDYRQPPREILEEKLGALALDEARVLFVLPWQHPPVQDALRSFRYTLRVCAQFRLSEHQCRAVEPFPDYRELILPQPAPRNWKPYDPHTMPLPNHTEEDASYWRIEQGDFTAL